ncbi:MAG: transketolase [Clostridia bacterium]|nr:transketolase [Clostridia bacterium]
MALRNYTETQLKNIATHIRMDIIKETHSAKSGHPGGSLSIADIMAYLYFEEMSIDPKNPECPDRDRLVLSKGHAAPALYAALAERGFFPIEDLTTLRRADSHLQGHPSLGHVPGIDMTTGSLGQGLSAACGMAISAKLQGKSYRTYAIVGDGESQEGQIWEALMLAAHRGLDNLCVILDWNGLQIDGEIEQVLNPTPYPEKLQAFGLHTIVVDGHDIAALSAAFDEARTIKGKPTAIIAKTVKGKGVSFMENRVEWHGAAPKDAQCEQALAELHSQLID